MSKPGSKKACKANWRQNTNHKAKYERQRIRTERNKARRSKKHFELHPNDLQGR